MENAASTHRSWSRFSNASLLTIASVATLLPQYSTTDGPEGLPVFQSGSPGYCASTTAPEGSSSPPRYSVNNPRHSIPSPVVDPISLTRRGCRFEYSYPIRPNKPWATLQLHTRNTDPGQAMPLRCQPKIPRFWSCDPVSGVLQLDLDGTQTIQHVDIVIKGKLVTSAQSEGTFLFFASEFTLWDKSFGNPLEYRTNGTQNSPDKTADGKFIAGQYTFPFSFPFPVDTEQTTKSISSLISRLSLTAATDAFSSCSNASERASTASSEGAVTQPRTSLASHIPQTFTENDVKIGIVYEIAVCFVHGIFRAKSKIKTNFFYIPALEPHAAPRRRREAYEAGALLPCPMNDPAGWFALPKVTIHGMINESQQPAKVDCILHVAEPLSYTRGSVIPCFLTLFSEDTEALRVLSLPNVPVVRLCRRVRHLTTSGEELPPSAGGAFNQSVITITHVPTPKGELKSVLHEVATAQWWTPSKDVCRDRNVGHLEGEIHLSPELQPTCDFQLFHVEYFVEILSFKMRSGGKSREQEGEVLASTPVDIVTIYREDEPVPTLYSERPNVLRATALK